MTQPNGDNDNRYKDGISLKAYVDTRFTALEDKIDSLEKLLKTMVDQIVDNTTLARTGMERRLDGMNEFRDALRDQAAMMVTRVEMEAAIKGMGGDIQSLRESRAELAGKASQRTVTVALILTTISLFIGVTAVLVAVLH